MNFYYIRNSQTFYNKRLFFRVYVKSYCFRLTDWYLHTSSIFSLLSLNFIFAMKN